MPRSLLSSFVRSARALLGVQLFLSVLVVGVVGWTLALTNGVIGERDRLRERVIQLEAEMGARGIVVPAAQNVVAPAPDGTALYPNPIEADAGAPAPAQRGIGGIIGDLFAPAPPMRLVVLHVRAEADAGQARRIGSDLQREAGVRVIIDVLEVRDPKPAGYIYFDGRQSAAAAALVTRFHDIARTSGVAEWSAQLRGAALPAQGEYAADRLDLTLPALPEPEPPPPPLAPQTSPPGEAPAETPQ